MLMSRCFVFLALFGMALGLCGLGVANAETMSRGWHTHEDFPVDATSPKQGHEDWTYGYIPNWFFGDVGVFGNSVPYDGSQFVPFDEVADWQTDRWIPQVADIGELGSDNYMLDFSPSIPDEGEELARTGRIKQVAPYGDPNYVNYALVARWTAPVDTDGAMGVIARIRDTGDISTEGIGLTFFSDVDDQSLRSDVQQGAGQTVSPNPIDVTGGDSFDFIFDYGYDIGISPFINDDVGDDFSFVIHITPLTIPEPGSVVLAAMAGLGLVGLVRHRRRKNAK